MHVFFTNSEPSFLVADRLTAYFADPLHDPEVNTITLQPPVKSKPIPSGPSAGVTRLSVISWAAEGGKLRIRAAGCLGSLGAKLGRLGGGHKRYPRLHFTQTATARSTCT